MKRVLVFGGPTGSGESTITNEIIKRYPNFKRLVTATSRAPRNKEQNKIDYYFFSKEDFEKKIESGDILEHTYVENRGVYYGAYKPDLDQKIADGFNVIANVDIVGAKYYKENYNAATIFIKPRSLDELRARLAKRDKNITPEELANRMKNAKAEMENEMDFYDYTVINADGKLEEAIEEIIKIIRKEDYKLS